MPPTSIDCVVIFMPVRYSARMANDAASERDVLWKDLGVWRAEVEVYVGPPAAGGGPQRSTGTMTTTKACGGTWLVSDYQGEQFFGHGMWTWDASKKKYVGVWADNMMQFVAPGEGTWDPATQTMTYVYEATIGDKAMRWRQTTRSIDDDTREFLSFVPHDAPAPMMKVVYRRVR